MKINELVVTCLIFADLILTFFLLSAALAAPINEDEVIEDGPLAMPQIEEGVIDVKLAGDDNESDEEVVEDAEAAFMRMMNLGMSSGGYPSWYGGMNPMMQYGGMNPMMQYGGMSPMMQYSGFNPYSYGGMDQAMYPMGGL